MNAHLRVSTGGILLLGVLLGVACGGGGGGARKPTALERANSLRAAGESAPSCASILVQEYSLNEPDCVATLSQAGYSSVAVGDALLTYYQHGPTEAAPLLRDYLKLSDFDSIDALSKLDRTLNELYEAARDGLGIADGRAIEAILEALKSGAGEQRFTVDEVLHLTALPAVQRFAPMLGFDQAIQGLPMSANVYFTNMEQASVNDQDMTITWVTRGGGDGPPLDPALGIKEVCGRDHCDHGMSNTDLAAAVTYYDVLRHPYSGRLRIEYRWFYGFQHPCNTSWFTNILKDADGSHNGDWERVWVTTNPTRDGIEAVTFFQHAGWYTRRAGGFELAGDRPAVYVGKRSHGSYDYRCTAAEGCTDASGFSCFYWNDFRNPLANNWWNSSVTLVPLKAAPAEDWIAADRSEYTLSGAKYTVRPWVWGPTMAFCSEWWGGPLRISCRTWEATPIYGGGGSGISSHLLDSWDEPSCNGSDPLHLDLDGCRRNQGWPEWTP